MLPFFGTNVVTDLGTVDIGKLICSLDEPPISTGIIVIFKKANVLLDRFDIIMRHNFKAGLVEKFWTKVQHRASLRGGGLFRETADDMFFAFPVFHLTPAFVVLIVGTILSSVVFIGELILNCFCKSRKKSNRAFGE